MSDRIYERSVSVALNDQGVYELNHCVISSDNVKEVFFYDDEAKALYDNGFVDAINDHYDLILSDYEDGIINSDFDFLLEQALAIEESCPTVFAVIKEACELGTSIDISL